MVAPLVVALGGAALRAAGPWLARTAAPWVMRTALPWLGRTAMSAGRGLATRFGPRISGWLAQRGWGRALLGFASRVGPKLGGVFRFGGAVLGFAGKALGLLGRAAGGLASGAMSLASDIGGAFAAGLAGGGGLFSLAGQFEAAVAGGGAAQSGMGTTVTDGLRKARNGQYGLAT
ncbi:hypothetical protein ACFPZ0_11680 [Streptomonospora nanhaiensis]|uniref:Uncharacterized protein n=1 Tax=Streptomonospora nanhaiensis TaxID=1323731 RepID=A0A853BMX9_9ACTN|nr:hypothetical protein [Streptomonospora nanhaiensis]MBV2366087.1 hypothetical protein [Streptomonospora nanhaiensis]MBX9388879.1 hypothetical protein [Streptomonospora nanhaiensis]NYI96563.1 hypothetical protein [Streptomonospora nanhaiensis]